MNNQMKTAVENADINNQVGGLNTDVMLTPESKPSFIASLKNAAMTKYLALALLATAPAMQSCEKTTVAKEQTDINAIDTKTDNPAHKAQFMADVKPTVLADGIATMEFDAVWNEATKGYELQPKSMVDFTKAAQKLEAYAKANNKNKEDLGFALYYRNNGSVRIWWVIPYADLVSIGGVENLNDNACDKYIGKSDLAPNGGNPDATVKKKSEGYLEINIGELGSNRVLTEIQSINPYLFGK
jgi:hypothetical protein